MDSVDFDRSKIYERLEFAPEPPGYSGKVAWKVQQQISATNGIHYADMVGKLDDYPIPDIPIEAPKHQGILLDIGTGWGRWLVAAGKKGYIPVGIDLRQQFCETALKVMQDNGVQGYALVADLNEIPFKDNIFEVAWSFSVIQHTHYSRLISCMRHIHRILHKGGYALLEFPNKSGLRNRFGPVRKVKREINDFNSWVVRYYSIKEYRRMFVHQFGNFTFRNHSFFGIGILPGDYKFVKGIKYKATVGISLLMSRITDVIKPLKYVADSIYVKSKKVDGEIHQATHDFLGTHKSKPWNNLNLLPLLRCPISGGNLTIDETNSRIISSMANVYYPVINNIPILIKSEAVALPTN